MKAPVVVNATILSPNGDGTWLALLVVDGEVTREALYTETGDRLALLVETEDPA